MNIQEIANFVEDYLNKNSQKYKKRETSGLISYELIKDKSKSTIDIVFLVDDFYLCKVNSKIETSSTSLADPRLAYQNTTARKVTYKKISKDIEVQSPADFVKIEKWLKKIL